MARMVDAGGNVGKVVRRSCRRRGAAPSSSSAAAAAHRSVLGASRDVSRSDNPGPPQNHGPSEEWCDGAPNVSRQALHGAWKAKEVASLQGFPVFASIPS